MGEFLEDIGISAEKTEAFFAAEGKSIRVFVFEKTASTNTDAKNYAKGNDSREATLFIAKKQSAGRGRLGKSFASDFGTGLYATLLFYPDENLDITKITPLAALATAKVLSALCGLEAKIKWVNDIYVGEKKLAGILTEGEFSENGGLKFAAVGFGINLYKTPFGDELSQIATDLETEGYIPPSREELAAKISLELLRLIEKGDTGAALSEYRERSCLTGARVSVLSLGEEKFSAKVLGIGESFELLLLLDDGRSVSLSTGEVSVKKID